MARVTIGWKDNGQPIYKALDYFERREDALICLANYNAGQFEIDYRDLTFEELYQKLVELEFPKFSNSLRASLSAAVRHCSRLNKVKYRKIKKFQMQSCIDSCERSAATKANIKNLFWHLDRLAFELDIITKRCSETLTVHTEEARERSVFTSEEVRRLWQHRGDADMALFMLYTGCRMSEMLLMRCEDVKDGYMIGGVKTAAGKNRVIPIHPDLQPVIDLHRGGEYLFQLPVLSKDPLPARKRSFLRRWDALMKELGMAHTSHDCRHTFRSKLDTAGANKVAVDLIMGHKSRDIGERVYTHKTIEELQEAVRMLKY